MLNDQGQLQALFMGLVLMTMWVKASFLKASPFLQTASESRERMGGVRMGNQPHSRRMGMQEVQTDTVYRCSFLIFKGPWHNSGILFSTETATNCPLVPQGDLCRFGFSVNTGVTQRGPVDPWDFMGCGMNMVQTQRGSHMKDCYP